jgi:arginine N-succinyltransferase
MLRHEIRAATPADLDALLALAQHLDSVNLPFDREHVSRLLTLSEQSFSGALEDLWQRRYVFLLAERGGGRALGTSMIVAQLGRRDAPYIYVDVSSEEKYSRGLDRHFHHTLLKVGYSYDGPTELGGLVVAPEARRDPDKLGLLISYVRFLFIATHRQRFKAELLAELLPPLEPDGTSHLWEALGRHFTGMSYAEADRRSSVDKEFIRDLFPSGAIYASVLPPEAQAVIGAVGRETRGVEKMLRRIGFRYAERVDPFDGGPHFVAGVDEVSLVRHTARSRVAVTDEVLHERYLVARSLDRTPWFHCVPANARRAEGRLLLGVDAAAALGVGEGDEVTSLPLKGDA